MSSSTQTDKQITAQMDSKGVIVTCSVCGQRNRLAWERLDAESRCGKSHTPLTAPGVPVDVPDAETFDALVSQSALPVVVDFWAPWCGPCRMVAPELARVAASNAGRFFVVKVNTDEIPELANRHTIRSIPTMAVFAQGRELARTAGARPAADIETFIRGAVANR